MPPALVPFAALDALGGYFTLRRSDSGGGWRSGTARIADLDAAVADYRSRLGTGRADLAASLLVQGWAARLCAVWIGCLAVAGRAPDLAADAVDLRLPVGRLLEARLQSDHTLPPAEAKRRLVGGHLVPLVEAVHDRYRTPRRRLWGNVAAVHAGAVASARHAGLVVPWHPAGAWARLGAFTGPTTYRRYTCCGLVRLPDRRACADCVLVWRSERGAPEELP